MANEDQREQYEEWLGRLDIPVEEAETIDELREMLRELLQWEPTDRQLQALWEARGLQWDLTDAGIKGLTIEYPWGKERRYGIQGLPGLWGWERVKEIMTQEGWW